MRHGGAARAVARLLLLAVVPALPVAAAAAPGADGIRLVLLITVDQLRGDVLPREAPDLPPGGFRRLMERGVYYTDAHFRHGVTFTAVGFASIATGADPAEHGITGNAWRHPESGAWVYSVEDPRHRVHGDPRPSPHRGTSPALLESSTIGDELVLARGGRVFGVSMKDRAAILTAGHGGTAWWYDSSRGAFVTSSYYMDAPPAWVDHWNAARPVERWRGATWDLLDDRATYRRRDADDRPFESDWGSLGTTFPHPLDDEAGALLTSTIKATPFADEMTADFAIALLEAEALATRAGPDLLSVSFSATDSIGHAFGPGSLEAEDNLRRLDRTIARLLDAVEGRVGLDRTIVVLSADHGIDVAPEARHAQACRDAACPRLEALPDGRTLLTRSSDACALSGRIDAALLVERANEAGRTLLGMERDVVGAFMPPGIHLDRAVLGSIGDRRAELEDAVARAVSTVDGVAWAITRSALLEGRVPDVPALRRIARSIHPRRSADVIVVPKPSWILASSVAGNTATHGSPHPYDTHVPVLFAVPGVAARLVERPVAPEDIAPTLARLLDVPLPTGCVGQVLGEVVGE